MAEDLKTKTADLVKKMLTVGVGAIFLTEESLRGLASEFKLPKELIGGILESAGKTKDEFLKRLSEEVLVKVVDKINPSELLQEFVTRNEIEIHIKLGIKPKKH